jgi:predicted permease
MTMATDRLARFLLSLYPRAFRIEFGEGWDDIWAWRYQTFRGRSFPTLRLIGAAFADTAKALPRAYRVAFAERRRDAVMQRRGRGRTAGGSMQGLGSAHRNPGRGLGGLGRDLKHAARGLARNPVFTVAAIASLALGIGANTAVFSVVNAVILRPLPYQEPERLAIVWNEFPGAGLERLPLSGVEVQGLADHPDLFEATGGIWATSRTMFTLDGPVTVSAALITPNFFGVLGVQPQVGQTFVREEGGTARPRGVIISDELWRGRFGADPDIVGRVLRVDAGETIVLAVMPRGFRLLFPPDGGIPDKVDLYVPLPWNLSATDPGTHYIRTVGRLRPSLSLVEAQEMVAAVSERMRAAYSAIAATGARFTIVPLHGDAVRAARPVLFALLGAVGLFLLLAAANVASLVLARTMTRGHEMAIRVSLGASRYRLAQVLFVEAALLTGIGGLAGIWLGRGMGRVLWALRPEGIARVDTLTLDAKVLAFSLAVTVLAGMVSAMVPLGQVSRVSPVQGFRRAVGTGSKGGGRAREVATAIEVAAGLVLFIGTALMAQTFTNLRRADVGFDPQHLLTFKVSLPLQRFPSDMDRGRLARELERRLETVAGVRSAGATSHLPFAQWANWGDAAPPEGVSETDRNSFFADHRSVTPGFFAAIGARVVAGRGFAEQDDLSSDPVVVVDRTFARRAFGDSDPVGKRLQASQYRGGQFVPTWATVVGVIEDMRDRSPATLSAGQVFWPFAQSPRWELTYVVRAEGVPTGLIDDVRESVTSVERDLAVGAVLVMDDYVESVTAETRYVVRLASVFAGLALLLAAFGLYGVISYNATRRVRELALRVALGAGPRDILGAVLRDGVRLGLLGVGVGVLGAVALTRFMGSMLYGVSATDPVTFLGGALILLVVAVASSVAPAYRATRADPVVAMQPE